MADINSSLPVRTQSNGDVVIEIADGTTPSQKMAVNSAGSAQVAGQGVAGTPAGGVVTVQGIAGGTVIPVSGTVTATNPSVSATGAAPPASATYVGGLASATSPTETSGDMYALSLTTAGALRVDASATTQPVSISGTVAENLTQVGGSAITLGQTTMSASLPVTLASNQSTLSTTNASVGATGSTAPTSATEVGALVATSAPTLTTGNIAALSMTTAGAIRTDASATTQPVSGTVTANQGGAPWSQNITQVLGAAPSATNALATQIATAGAYVSSANPLPVIIDPSGAGTVQYYYTDAAATAVGATATNSTTVAGATGFYITQMYVAGSGKFKALIQTETAAGSGTFTTRFVTFNSTATPYAQVSLPQPLLVVTGARVQVLMTNLDLLAQDLYSTVTGYQI